MSRINQLFGEILRDARHQKNMTQEDLAEKSGIHRNHISFMERGLRSPSLETLFRVCQALDIEASKIVTDVEHQLRSRVE
jgi:transcriptional regulator with XRE-family HTH domain